MWNQDLYAIEPAAAENLLAAHSYVAAPELEVAAVSDLPFYAAYVLDDGQVLFAASSEPWLVHMSGDMVNSEGMSHIADALLFPSVKVFLEAVRQSRLIDESMQTSPDDPISGAHILRGEVFAEPNFAHKVQGLVKQLAATLNTTEDVLDQSIESLLVLDELIRQRGHRESRDNSFFPLLVAYAGEVIKQATSGSWITKHDEQYHVWEPYVRGASGAVYNPWLNLYKSLDEPIDNPTYVTVTYEIDFGFLRH